MIEFKHITLDDKEAIEKYTLTSTITSCYLAFANMVCWNSTYHSHWAIIDGFLVIRFIIDADRIEYMQPIGDGDFVKIIPQLQEDAHKHGKRFTIIDLTEEGCNAIRKVYKDKFAFVTNKKYDDYIYNADDLRNLVGRKYQPKRNHINQFMAAYHHYKYEVLTSAHREECMAFVKKWQKTDQDGEQADDEIEAITYAFANYESLGFIGGCIYVDNQLVAFTFGTAINNSTFGIHVEKADTTYKGVYATINRLFSEHIPSQYTLINREEDLGIEGLRRSKQSYYPAIKQSKYLAVHLRSDELACKKMWQNVFGDDDEFIDTFMVFYYQRSNMLSIEVDGKMVSMLHLLQFDSERGRTTYIYGVATTEEYRGRGYASKLMRQAMDIISEGGDDIAVVIPGSDSLRGYYHQFGFEGSIKIEFSLEHEFDFGTGDSGVDIAMIWLADKDKSRDLPETLNCVYHINLK